MAISRTALLALFVILLLVPVASFSPTFAYKQTQTSQPNQTSQKQSDSNATVAVPLSLPSVIPKSVSLGPLSPQTQVSLGLVLPIRDHVGLQNYIDEISSNNSKLFHKFITEQQFSELYGPSASESRSLAAFLSSNGLSVSFDNSNPYLLLASGSAAAAEKALHVSIESYRLSGTSYYSATSNIRLPSQFSNIQTAFGLTSYKQQLNASATPMYKVFGAVNSTQSNSASVYYSPSEIGQIYNATSLWNSGYNGSGITIAIVDAYGDPYIQQELDNFSAEFHLSSTTVNEICVDGPCDYYYGITSGWATEVALDVEWTHAMAPGARINLYIGSNDTFPLFDAVQKAVSDGVNSVISLSWGSPENAFAQSGPVAPVFGENYPWLDQVFQQAAAEGITVFASSGDWGAYNQAQGETSPYGGAIYPSTDPYVTGVGGTSVFMNSTSGYFQIPYANAQGGYGTETAWSWNDNERSATGGGYSTFFGTPYWQSGLGFSGSSRGAPDVAWEADPATGVLVAMSNGGGGFTYFVVGGTSVGSPSWAGSLALLDQKEGGKLGFINPTLYSIINNPAEYSRAFHDITVGNNNPNSATVGWDPLTGLGTPNLGELANYLAPTGSLYVSVQNQLSSSPSQSFSYGSTIILTAKVTSGSSPIASGSVIANLAGPSGEKIAQNVPLTFNTISRVWSGEYVIKSTDPAGMWSAQVSAESGGSAGSGSTTFSVGDGVTILLPYYNATTNSAAPVFVIPGEVINVSAKVTSPSGQCCIRNGNFVATFNLNSPSGKLEGSVPMKYNSLSQYWYASFKVPISVDQGAWILIVSGTDGIGNKGSAYSWLNVGLNVLVSTDASSYVRGDKVTVLSAPLYPDGLVPAVGNFSATISSGSKIIARVPMTFSWLYVLWTGSFTLSQSDPTGFYNVTVSGNDGAGVSGSFSTIIRVAPYSLLGRISLPSSSISINGGNVATISARIEYPNGAVLRSGSVEAFVSYDMSGVLVPSGHLRLTYQSNSQSFVGPNVFPAASALTTAPGKYLVTVLVSDSAGDYGNFTTSFFVNANPHPPISITSDSQFTTANGVIKGTGTSNDPYIIAGWNTTSINVSSSLGSSYQILNDWVQGSTSSGIMIDTPSSAGVSITNITSISNHANGLEISGISNILISGVDASNNSGSGIILSGNGLRVGGISSIVAANNGKDGIDIFNAPFLAISSSTASTNSKYGFYVYNSMNVTLYSDNATRNSIGAEITGTSQHGYGGAIIFGGYYDENGVGIEVNGMGQTIQANSTKLSSALIELTAQLANNIGTLSLNDSVVTVGISAIGLNNYGVLIQNSLPLVVGNIITQNSKTGLNITGPYTGNGYCEVQFVNLTITRYDSCIASNYLTLNGGYGSSLTSLRDSFTGGNAALGNVIDGFKFDNLTGSLITTQVSVYNGRNGITVAQGRNSRITQNTVGGNLNGLEMLNSNNNTVDLNNATLNYLDGVVLSTSGGNIISNNTAIQDASGCSTITQCTAAAGIELYSSSGNIITNNTLTNNTSTSIGAGIYIYHDSNDNSVTVNNATLNYAGILISSSSSNHITKNTLSSNTYGVYLLNAPLNSITSNLYENVRQSIYPNQPTVEFTGISNGTTVSGLIDLVWQVSGQAITHQNLTIDGKTTAINGTAFALNSTLLPDAHHTISIKVTNVGGLSASSSVTISTRNHEGLLVFALGPSDTHLSGVPITLKNSLLELNSTTGPNGATLFPDLKAGQYTASAVVNGTYLSLPVSFNINTSVSLFFPIITTTIPIPSLAQGSEPTLRGNITSSDLTNVQLTDANGVYGLSFNVTGAIGTLGKATLTIHKSVVPGGLTPNVLINGALDNNTSYTQDSQYYHITFTAPLGGSTNVSVQFSHHVRINFDLLILIVVVVSLAAAWLSIVFGRPKKYYAPAKL